MELSREQNQAVRQQVRALLAQYHGNMTSLARALGVSQSQISQFLGGKTGAGMKLLRGLSRRTLKSIDEILGKEEPDHHLRVMDLEDENRELRSANTRLAEALRKVQRDVAAASATCGTALGETS